MNILNGLKKVVTSRKFTIASATVLITSGIIMTAITAIKDTPKVERLLNEATEDKGEDLTTVEKAEICAKGYWKTIAMASITILLVAGMVALEEKNYASLACAYTLAEDKIIKYKDAVFDVVGDKKVGQVLDKVCENQMKESPINNTTIINTEKGKSLFFDTWTGRYFYSDMETIRRVLNDINRMMIDEDYVSADEFYWKLGLPESGAGAKLGWTLAHNKNIDIRWGSVLTEDGVPCVTMTWVEEPVFNFDTCW